MLQAKLPRQPLTDALAAHIRQGFRDVSPTALAAE